MTEINAELDMFYIQVNGADLPLSVMAELTEVVVEDDLEQPAVFTLRFYDDDLSLIDGNTFRLGDEIELSASDVQQRRKIILNAEVTALEPEMSQERIELIVRGYDRSHRLYRGRATRTFMKQTYAEIFRKVAEETGLSARVIPGEAVNQKFDYIVQDGQTDMAFLRELASSTGYCITVDKRTLIFGPDSQRSATAPLQKFGDTLLNFRARITVASQPNEVEVRGWNPSAKQPIVGNAIRPSQHPAINNGTTGGDSAKRAFSKAAKVIVCDRPVGDSQEARTLAQATLDALSGDYLSAEATCIGEPQIKAGATVELKGIGDRFSGVYLVTATRHEYIEGCYRTTLFVSGRHPTGLLSPIQGAEQRHLVHGVVVALVTNVKDPQQLGRVKVKYPWFDGNLESDWVRIAAPGGGVQRGLMALPEINDEMLVAFEHGDMNRPYILGGLWNPKDKPPATAVDGEGKVMLRTIRTRAGHIIEFLEDGADGKGAIEIKTANGLFVKLSDNDKLIRVKSAKHTVTLDDQGTGSVTVTSGGTLELTGAGSKLLFRQGAMELTGPGGAKLAFTPAGAELTAMGNKVALNPPGITVSATAELGLKAAALANMQAALVKIN